VEIGDVGILTKHGGFETFFNITVPGDAQRGRVPPNFVPFNIDFEEDVIVLHDIIPDSYISSGLQTQEVQEESRLTWELTKGAILILKDAPTEISIPPNVTLRDYVDQNHSNWYEFIQSPDGLKRILRENERLILVTAIYRSDDWSLGAWPSITSSSS
ncbi:hypothetical protein DL96DRAFT_1499529, partial [Flagelloscypha sp. PMI_526]